MQLIVLKLQALQIKGNYCICTGVKKYVAEIFLKMVSPLRKRIACTLYYTKVSIYKVKIGN